MLFVYSAATQHALKLMFQLIKPNFMLNPSKAVRLAPGTIIKHGEIMLEHFGTTENALNFPKHKTTGRSIKASSGGY